MTHVTALYVYPAKGLRRIEQEYLDLEPWGPRGDRRWMIVSPDGRFMTQRQYPEMATLHATPSICRDSGYSLTLSAPARASLLVSALDNASPAFPVSVWKDRDILAQDAGDDAALWLRDCLDTECRLVFMQKPELARLTEFGSVSFADGFPLLVTNTASLDDLNLRLNEPVPMERFRPNIVISHSAPWAEDQWKRLQIGETVIECVKPCSRCIVTTIDQENGTIPVPREPLKTLTRFRHQTGGVMFGQNAIIHQTGRIRLGDTVQWLD